MPFEVLNKFWAAVNGRPAQKPRTPSDKWRNRDPEYMEELGRRVLVHPRTGGPRTLPIKQDQSPQ